MPINFTNANIAIFPMISLNALIYMCLNLPSILTFFILFYTKIKKNEFNLIILFSQKKVPSHIIITMAVLRRTAAAEGPFKSMGP
jgi:hypothetical protein